MIDKTVNDVTIALDKLPEAWKQLKFGELDFGLENGSLTVAHEDMPGKLCFNAVTGEWE